MFLSGYSHSGIFLSQGPNLGFNNKFYILKGPPATALGPFIQSCVWTDVSGNESIFPFGNKGRNPYLEGSQIKLPWWLGGQESVCQAGVLGSIPGLGRSPWRSKWLPTQVFLLGKSHVQKSLVGYSPWSHKRVRHDLAIKWQHSHIKIIFG